MWAIWRRFRCNKNVEFVIKTNGTRKLNLRAWPSIEEAGGLLKTTSKVGMDLVAKSSLEDDAHIRTFIVTRLIWPECNLNFFQNVKICTFWIFIAVNDNYEQNSKHRHQARQIKIQTLADFYIVYNCVFKS